MCYTCKKQVILVGDHSCGKTALALRLSQGLFNEWYEPTCFDNFTAEVLTEKESCHLSLLDTAGTPDCMIRQLAYKGCDAVVLCFDLTQQGSLDSVESKWLPELNKHCPGTPFYFVGCKSDAMCAGRTCTCEDGKCCLSSEQEVMDLVERTGAVAYTECSALTSEGVDELFQFIVDMAAKAPPKRRRSSIMASIKRTKSKIFKKLTRSSTV